MTYYCGVGINQQNLNLNIMKAQTTNTKTENAYLIVILFQLLTFATLGTIFVAYGISTFINLIINL